VCGSVRDLTSGVIALVKSSAPPVAFPLWFGVQVSLLPLYWISGLRVLLVNRSSGEPELCTARVFCAARSLGHGCLNFILGYAVA
jgi:hypothetical protein